MDLEKETKEYIECDCGTEILQLTLITGNANTTESKEYFIDFYIALYTYGYYAHKYPILKRLKYIWHLIKTGEAHSDQVILNSEEFQKLKKFINSINVS
jgi:hypothetical protein